MTAPNPPPVPPTPPWPPQATFGAPVPIAALAYEQLGAPRPARPGALTAVGVISIILGALGALGSVMGVFQTFVYRQLAAMPAPGVVAVTGPGAVNRPSRAAAAPALLAVSANAVTTADALAALEPMTVAQRDQVMGLLAVHGDWVLAAPDGGAGWTVADAKATVRSHGRLDGAGGGFYFTTADGRLEVDDAGATFRPTGQPLLSMSVRRDGAGQLVRATDGDDGGAGAGTPGVAPAATMPVMPAIRVAPGAMRLSLVTEGAGILLAGLLLAAGVQVLRDVPAGRRLHLWWVALKLPMIALTAAATAWTMSSMFASFAAAPGMPAGGFGSGAWVIAGGKAVFQLIYPVVLLVVMNTRRVKDWFSPGMAAGQSS